MSKTRLFNATATLVVVLAACQGLTAQQLASVRTTEPREGGSFVAEPAINSDEVIQKFLKAEQEMREALNQHSFEREVVIQTLNPAGEVTGQYVRRSKFVLDDKGNRVERVLFHPSSTLKGIKISREDVQDLAGTQLIGWDYWDNSKYNFRYAGIENINGQNALAIDVSPAQKPDPYRMRDRYFVGRLHLDPATHQILLIEGRTEPQGKQRFPKFVTHRETVSGPYLFPVTTYIDDVLTFPDRTVRIRVNVRFYNYRRFGSTVKITEVDEP